MKPAEILMEIAVFFVRAVFIIAMVSVLITRAAFAEETIFPGKPEAVIDLGTKEGVALVKGEWRYHDTE